MNWKRIALSGWGRTSSVETLACRPERRGEVEKAFADPQAAASVIAFGAGRSYGDAALNGQGATVLTQRLDRLLDFSPDSGVLVCEPGVTFEHLMRTFLHRGWSAPVSPGTAFATVGGAIANDVHGKNHDRSGSFGDHVAWLDLALPDGRVLRAAPDENADLFAATIGGVGLTGVITRAAIRLAKVESSHVVVRESRADGIEPVMAALREARGRSTYSVAWIDAVARGAGLGRGVVEAADPAPQGLARVAPRRAVRFPVDLPGLALNPVSIGLFNQVYYRRVPKTGRERTLPLDTFLYPLDAIADWNRMYGKTGFFQFQCVLPEEQSDKGIPALIEAIAAERAASFLAVLKTLGREGRGHLSFARPGFTLALDFPARAGTGELMRRLERLTLDHGGRIYLAKDASLSPEGFRRMYPKLPAFRDVLERLDPTGRMNSDLARRLRVREKP